MALAHAPSPHLLEYERLHMAALFAASRAAAASAAPAQPAPPTRLAAPAPEATSLPAPLPARQAAALARPTYLELSKAEAARRVSAGLKPPVGSRSSSRGRASTRQHGRPPSPAVTAASRARSRGDRGKSRRSR